MLNDNIRFLISLIGSGLLASVVAAVIARYAERARWIRNQKLKASAKFLKAMHGMSSEMQGFRDGSATSPANMFQFQIDSENSLLQLLAPETVVVAAQKVTDAVGTWAQTLPASGGTWNVQQTEVAFRDFRELLTDFAHEVRVDLGTTKKKIMRH